MDNAKILIATNHITVFTRAICYFIPITCLIFMFSNISCSSNEEEKPSQTFVFPEVIDSLEPAVYYYSPTLLSPSINFIQTLQKIGHPANLLDTLPYVSYINDHHLSDTTNKSVVSSSGLSLLIDTTREVPLKNRGILERPPFFFDKYKNEEGLPKSKMQQLIDSLNTANRWQAWEENATFVKGFPVYIVNQSKQAVRVEIQDGQLMIIQEALDPSGKWRPIEYWRYSGCGNSYDGIALRPDHYLMTKVFKYQGNFETLLRLKMRNDTVIYYSPPFRGSIYLTQMDTALVERKFHPRHFFNLEENE